MSTAAIARRSSAHAGPVPPPPPSNLNSRPLPIVTAGTNGDWFRIFRNDHARPKAKFFGTSGRNRFDALKQNFGVLYLADSISCSFAEVWLREPHPKKSLIVDAKEFAFRSLAQFRIVRPISLVDLVDDGLAKLGLDASIVAARNYTVTKAWSSAFHAHPSRPDGIYYSSRLNLASRCVALFERASDKVDLVFTERLDTDRGAQLIAPSFRKFNIGVT